MKRGLVPGFSIGLIVVAALVLCICTGCGPTGQEIRTEALLKRAEMEAWRSAGLVKKAIEVDGDRVVYLEGGKGETVLLLHGFADNKDAWLGFAEPLIRDYHVIVPDLPGFGESTKRFGENYNVDSQVKRLDRFVEALGQGKFHLAGNSMGGTIAAVYAARRPQRVLSLALLDPMGVVALKIAPMEINSTGDYEKVLPYLFVNIPQPCEPFRKTMTNDSFEEAVVSRFKAARLYNEKIWLDLIREGLSLRPFLPLIQAPVLIVWGDHDRIFDVSGASILEKGLKHHQTVILKDTGHLPMTEKPAQTAAAYISFLKNRQRM